MGGGSWTHTSYESRVMDMGFDNSESIKSSRVQDFYKSRTLDAALSPYNVIRECCDSEEHPNTIPIILALDVTGSMGQAAKTCASALDDIMSKLYEKYNDIEFMMMGIGDLSYDHAPIQVTQFESDIRILDQTSKIWFERGGGPNSFESYTAAWYFGTYRTKLDCWKRGKKGIIITMGDEQLNPYLPSKELIRCIGNRQQQDDKDIETPDLYRIACEKFDIFHIGITDEECSFSYLKEGVRKTWKAVLGQRYLEGSSDDLPTLISQIVDEAHGHSTSRNGTTNSEQYEGIRW